MKKHILIASALLTASMLFGQSVKIQGTIAQIYDNNKTLLIDSIYGGQVAIKVLPNTKIEMDDCGIFGTDKDGAFKDLKIGDFLESKIAYENSKNLPLAKKIEIQCYKKAY
ncbi:hypothetical protein OXW40_04525 [Campylobacter hepaticus]|uniref:hypothetical protein n=1 Tax=Campylobacter hepaticus TaxID=1813019 RepID=UPI0029BF5848|nr:hypothetical protein [Campylobacter hepaticus]MDX2323499.1 hypothetical protein [Campylobacter hepaticus]MDX2332633.1 hypothetical protein [Campylobacter hepaticus]MDX2409748.1 hypothetical protein [Campylobacter hepaticus]